MDFVTEFCVVLVIVLRFTDDRGQIDFLHELARGHCNGNQLRRFTMFNHIMYHLELGVHISNLKTITDGAEQMNAEYLLECFLCLIPVQQIQHNRNM